MLSYNEYCIENGRASRDVAGIRRKFNSLEPTGDPTCPPEVKRAKEASRMITESVDFGGLDDMDDDDDSWDEQHDEHAEGLDDLDMSASSRHSSTHSEAPAAKRGASEVGAVSKKKNKATVNGVMDSLAAFLDVDKRDERERSSEVIAMYRQQIEHLRQDCRELRKSWTIFAARIDSQFQRERAELAAERDRALQKLLVYELMYGKS
ncbi:hypothetical protein V1520DRAFT_282267 [Lipomyces starkeyi]|uniref:DUF6818 domain-containing protein n=1 Tax=Lipomyces starkeyi NRRL Y-11557 TaxID=675824 RepID=A0A1E3QE65_LIPST|nr:hypothetical protein LIPSTDRAFT_68680 [Lipomyces starkeyi NRRL Y-11557]